MIISRYRKTMLAVSFLLFFINCLLFAVYAFAQDDPAKADDKKKAELVSKEEALQKEEQRLNALKKDVDERIDKYTKILAKIEEAIKNLETVRNERMEHLVKTYEAMPNEDAAARLSALDEPTAVKIIVKMKSKKAGGVMALMATDKAAAITGGILTAEKKIPIK